MKLNKLKYNRCQFICDTSKRLEGFISTTITKCYYKNNIAINYSERGWWDKVYHI